MSASFSFVPSVIPSHAPYYGNPESTSVYSLSNCSKSLDTWPKLGPPKIAEFHPDFES